MQELNDPLGIGAYMRSRMRELLGPDVLSIEPFDIPRFARNEPSSILDEPYAPFYINPNVEFSIPELEFVAPNIPGLNVPPITEKARGHRPIPGGGTEILESPNVRPARPPRRLFRVDVTENDDFYFLRADLAGMSKDCVKISVVGEQNLVTINVEPPKNDFFGLYKSPLESQAQISSVSEVEKVEEKGPGEKENVPVSKEKSEEADVGKKESEAGKKESEISSKKEICHLIERCTQGMSRSLKMPITVDMQKVSAEMRDGLLVVKFAKKPREMEESKKHTIEIK